MTTATPVGSEPSSGDVVRSRRVARLLAILRSRRELARLNHVLLPAKKTDRDRLRKSWVGKLAAPMFVAYSSLSREGRALFMLSILVGFAGLDVMQSEVHLLFAMLAGLVIASLVARPWFRARGMRLSVSSAQRVAVGAPQRLIIHVENSSDRALLSVRVLAPFLPWDGKWVLTPEGIARVEPRGRASVVAEATFAARGEHHLDAFEAALLVPMGLALGPRRQSDGARFVVVPRITKVGSLTLDHVLPRSPEARTLSRSAGETEFAGVRPYRSGDSLKHLHARTWARTGVPHVKTYAAEMSERPGLAVALDGILANDTVKEAAVNLSAGVVARVIEQGGSIAALVIDHQLHRIEPRAGQAALDACLDRLAVHPLTYDDEPVEDALREAAPALSSLVFISVDRSPRRAALVDGLRASGLPVRWIVVEDGEGSAPTAHGPITVGAAAIERDEVIVL